MNLGDLLSLLYEAVQARKTTHIDMMLESDRYVFHAAPEGSPPSPVINVGTYTPNPLGPKQEP
jgi:hypothetical protein